MALVASLGCALCRRIGFPGTPAQVHHPRNHTGLALRASHKEAIPLCIEHHLGKTGVHELGRKGLFELTYGFSESDLVEDTRKLMEEKHERSIGGNRS